MIPHTKKYHFITIHFGNEVPTKTLVAHLSQNLPSTSLIVVIDNSDVPLKLFSSSRVIIVRPAKNVGYGAGINLGLGILTGRGAHPEDIVVALNNDVVIDNDSIPHLVAWWEKQSSPLVAGLKTGYVDLLTGRSHLGELPVQATRYLPYLHGSLVSASLETFLVLQGFSTQNFLYWEDVALSRRAQQLGLPLVVIPNTHIVHNDQPLRPSSPDQLYYLVRNGAVFLSRFSPRPWRYYWQVLNPVRLLYHTIRATPAVRDALRDALQNKVGKRA